jgi:hypothetical protein
VEGNVQVTSGAARTPARAGEGVAAGHGVVTAGAAARAALAFPDGTRLELGADTSVRELAERRGKRLTLAQGRLSAEVSKQPADQAMVFVTPHAEARVLGTSLRITVDASSTWVEVREGKVRLTREGRSVDIGPGQAASALANAALVSRPVDLNEIVLPAREGKIAGAEWSLVADRRASGGAALEALGTKFDAAEHVAKRPSHVAFTFYAVADREYRVWVRAWSMPTRDPWLRDWLIVDPPGARLNQKCRFFGTSGYSTFMTGGLSASPGYAWVSGFADQGEAAPYTVRFAQSGPQTLRLFVAHPSIRVDAVWLSATQAGRPPARQLPPADK